MGLIISHRSALEFWRKVSKGDLAKCKILHNVEPSVESINEDELRKVNFRDFSKPLHVLVGNGNARSVMQSLKCHVGSGEYPSESFIQTPSGLIVCSPELCFLQLAGEFSTIDLVQLGYELCGSYRLDKRKGFDVNMPRLTNVGKLKTYITNATGLYGRKNALKVANLLIDGSASPRETVLAMLLTLPYMYGGYGFPKPLLNHGIEVSEKVIGEKETPKFYCDLYWPDKEVIAEYDSDEHHTGSLRIEKDGVRRNALTSTGMTVVTVTRRQINSPERLRELSVVLSKLLGKRLAYPVKEFTSRNIELIRHLLPDEPLERYS